MDGIAKTVLMTLITMMWSSLSASCVGRVSGAVFSRTGVVTSQLSPVGYHLRYMSRVKTRHRAPRHYWQQKTSSKTSEDLSSDNEQFVRQLVQEKRSMGPYAAGVTSAPPQASALHHEHVEDEPWTKCTMRCGLIAKKIGIQPMWTRDGQVFISTLLHVSDNRVVRYLTPEQLNDQDSIRYRWKNNKKLQYGGLVVGADQDDPRKFTKEYSNLFANAGLLPMRRMARFIISPSTAPPLGTWLRATHFQIDDTIDVFGVSIERGFQGVMKRWGFHGMPATHGVTKSHRRPGCIGSGCAKARVWPGQKMPGHMGGDNCGARGLTIVRINTKYDVIYVRGQNIPGDIGSYVLLYDTVLPTKRRAEAPKLYSEEEREQLPEDLFHPNVHVMSEPTITF